MENLPLWVQVIAALSGTLGGIGGIIAIIRLWKRDKWEGEYAGKRTEAEVTAAITASAVNLVNELQERVEKLHGRCDMLEGQRDKFLDRVDALEEENRALKAELALLREVVKERDARIGELECENKSLNDEVSRLKERVKELEKNGNSYRGTGATNP